MSKKDRASALLVRVDGNAEIGAGHVMRCCAVAQAAQSMGCRVEFLVSDEESAAMLAAQSFAANVTGDVFFKLGVSDAEKLVNAAGETGATGVLVDSYGATDRFFEELSHRCIAAGIKIGYIDDEFRFSTGCVDRPVRLPVDVLVSYGFAADREAYEREYASSGTKLLIGPLYAPLRKSFCCPGYEVAEKVDSVLVATGATNPKNSLEKMVSCCAVALPDSEINVVVGSNASYAGIRGPRVVLHRAPSDMSKLMLNADLVVSAAGTTLYELASLGVPTVAVPITENQMANVSAWRGLALGPSAQSIEWSPEDLIAVVRDYAMDYPKRRAASEKLRQECDGMGAARVVETLVGGGVISN